MGQYMNRRMDHPEFRVAKLGEAFTNAARVFKLVWETTAPN